MRRLRRLIIIASLKEMLLFSSSRQEDLTNGYEMTQKHENHTINRHRDPTVRKHKSTTNGWRIYAKQMRETNYDTKIHAQRQRDCGFSFRGSFGTFRRHSHEDNFDKSTKMKNLTNYVALVSVPRVNVSIDLSANNVTRNVTSQATTATDLAERNRFMVGVITCFSVLLACVFVYVIYNHIKRVKEWNKEQKAKLQIKDDENEPVLSKKTSVIAQGQKQLVIERKPSVNSRRVSQGSGGSSSSHPLLKKVRSLNDQQDSSLLNNCDLLPTCKSDNFLSSKYRGCTRGPQEYRHVNSYLDNVLIRYNSLSRQSKEVSDIEEFSDSNENSDDEDKLYKQEEEEEVEEQDSFHDVPHPYLESNDYTSISFPVHSNLREV